MKKCWGNLWDKGWYKEINIRWSRWLFGFGWAHDPFVIYVSFGPVRMLFQRGTTELEFLVKNGKLYLVR